MSGLDELGSAALTNAEQHLELVDRVQPLSRGDRDVDLLREDTALVKLPLYKENEAAAGFTVSLLDNHVDPTALFLNLTFDDPVWRAVTGDLRFRQRAWLQAEGVGVQRSFLGENPARWLGYFR